MTSLENESTPLSESIHTSNENEEESLSADSTKSLENDSIHNDTIYDPKNECIYGRTETYTCQLPNQHIGFSQWRT